MSDLQCAVRVLCVRHAAAEGKPRLAGDDKPLSDVGRRRARGLSERLRSERVSAVHSSPYARRGPETCQGRRSL